MISPLKPVVFDFECVVSVEANGLLAVTGYHPTYAVSCACCWILPTPVATTGGCWHRLSPWTGNWCGTLYDPFCLCIYAGDLGLSPKLKDLSRVCTWFDSGEIPGWVQSIAHNAHPSIRDHTRLCSSKVWLESKCFCSVPPTTFCGTAQHPPSCSNKMCQWLGHITDHPVHVCKCKELY